MKKVFLSIFFVAFCSIVGFAQGEPAFKWEKMTHNFGKIAQGKPVTATFKFTNIGKTPIVISGARGSCGCTVPNYPKDPVAPGETAEITAVYNAAAVGAFNKTVTIDANTKEPQTILNIQGEVLEQKSGQK